MSPREVDRLTLWEWNCVMEGLAEFHGARPAAAAPAITDDDEDMFRQLGLDI